MIAPVVVELGLRRIPWFGGPLFYFFLLTFILDSDDSYHETVLGLHVFGVSSDFCFFFLKMFVREGNVVEESEIPGGADVGGVDDLFLLKNLFTTMNLSVDDQKIQHKGISKSVQSRTCDDSTNKGDYVSTFAEMLSDLSIGDDVSTFEFPGTGVIGALRMLDSSYSDLSSPGSFYSSSSRVNSESGSVAHITGAASPSISAPTFGVGDPSTRSRSSPEESSCGKGNAVLKPAQEEGTGPQTRNATQNKTTGVCKYCEATQRYGDELENYNMKLLKKIAVLENQSLKVMAGVEKERRELLEEKSKMLMKVTLLEKENRMLLEEKGELVGKLSIIEKEKMEVLAELSAVRREKPATGSRRKLSRDTETTCKCSRNSSSYPSTTKSQVIIQAL